MEKKNLALNIENLSVKYKIYEGILEVIPGLSMHVEQAERVGLIGETGCGKTTVLKSAAAVLQSLSGHCPQRRHRGMRRLGGRKRGCAAYAATCP
ncbi:MAG: ATP-binding cassette domain-containing protein [Oscillospiraceae bacterium]